MKQKEEIKDITVWQVATLALVIAFIMLVIVTFFIPQKEITCSPCNYILSTPSWLINNKIAGTGYQPNMTTQLMIDNNITLIYRDNCGWCDKQKETLDMDELTKRGLAIKCNLP